MTKVTKLLLCLSVLLFTNNAIAGSDEDYLQQRELHIKGAKAGKAWDMFQLGAMYEQGRSDFPADLKAAYDLYEQAADKGERLARRKVCQAYLLGENRPKDVVKAMTYCDKLGVKDPVGLFSFGYDYQYGLSGPADEALAMSLYVDAVTLGSGDAADALGQKALSLGRYESAIKWFRSGVYLGSIDAMDHLAQMRELGQGGPKDERESRWLYYLAALGGNRHAIDKDIKGTYIGCLEYKNDRCSDNITTKYQEKQVNFTVSVKNGKPRHIDFNSALTELGNAYLSRYINSGVSGDFYAAIYMSCYVSENHEIDLCAILNEYPVGSAFGMIAQSYFSDGVTIQDLDAKGFPTANSTLVFKITAKMN